MTQSWRDRAACSSTNLDYFSTNQEEKYEARAVCMSKCPVRWDCLEFAVQHHQIWGIWGGVDEYEIRRALSVDRHGEPVHRARLPRCPFCSKQTLVDIQKKRARKLVRCSQCGLEWWIKRAARADTSSSAGVE